MKAFIRLKKEKPHTLTIVCEKTEEEDEEFQEDFEIEEFCLITE